MSISYNQHNGSGPGVSGRDEMPLNGHCCQDIMLATIRNMRARLLWRQIVSSRSAILFFGLLFVYDMGNDRSYAFTRQPNLQEIQARHEIDLIKMQKQQQVEMLVKKRDGLMMSCKTLMQNKSKVYHEMKVAEQGYKSAKAQFNGLAKQLHDLEGKIGQVLGERNFPDQVAQQQKLQKLRDVQARVMDEMKNISKIQHDSYTTMQGRDSQYRSLTLKEQLLRQQIDSVQQQIQFIVSQP